MLKHAVLLKFKEGYSEETLKEVEAGLAELPGKISEIVNYSFGRNAGIVDGAYDFAVVGDFETAEDCLNYLSHPDHQAVGAKMITLIADASQIQFTF